MALHGWPAAYSNYAAVAHDTWEWDIRSTSNTVRKPCIAVGKGLLRSTAQLHLPVVLDDCSVQRVAQWLQQLRDVNTLAAL